MERLALSEPSQALTLDNGRYLGPEHIEHQRLSLEQLAGKLRQLGILDNTLIIVVLGVLLM